MGSSCLAVLMIPPSENARVIRGRGMMKNATGLRPGVSFRWNKTTQAMEITLMIPKEANPC